MTEQEPFVQTPKDHLEIFFTLVQELRDSQRYYFKNKNQVNLRLCLAKEREVDDCMRRLLKMGYSNKRERMNKPQQAKIFS